MNIGIIGYGKMGAAITKCLAPGASSITIIEKSRRRASVRGERFLARLERSLKRRQATPAELQAVSDRYHFTHRIESLAAADLIIEAVSENTDLKKRLLQQVEREVRPDAILATNSSSIAIAELAAGLKQPDRFCGLHFFHPVLLINLVEIIRLPITQPTISGTLAALCQRVGKTPIVTRDAPGSMINAVLIFYYLEALFILDEGLALPSEIDAIARKFCYIGPCESLDTVGIDLIYNGLQNTLMQLMAAHAEGRRLAKSGGHEQPDLSQIRREFLIPQLLERLVADNRSGKKKGKGIYLYPKGRPIDDARGYYTCRTIAHRNHGPQNLDKWVARRLLFAIYNGSLYCLGRKLAPKTDIDYGVKSVLQMTQGPLTEMEQLGWPAVRAVFDQLQRKVGERFAISVG